MNRAAATTTQRVGVEWRTVLVAVAIHASWVAIVLRHDALPALATVICLAVVVAWHGSLQHEVIHGHPFRSRAANDALGVLPLSPRIPYLAYRRYHLRHHASPSLTDPFDDVESYYLTPAAWAALSRPSRWLVIAHSTLLGRMVLGPARELTTVWRWQLREIRAGDRELRRWWATHLVACAVLAVVAVGVAGMPVAVYAAALYLGHALSLVRSFCEHRWVPGSASRSAVVRSGRFFSLLFLNNNLHHTHHVRPDAPWYRLPGLAAALDSDGQAAAGAGLYRGYLDVARRYLLRPTGVLVHPDHDFGGADEPRDPAAHRVGRPAARPAAQPAS